MASVDGKEVIKRSMSGTANEAQALGLPDYTVITESGPPHARHFEVICKIDELKLESKGVATSRRRAEQTAAAVVLEMLDNSHE